MAELVANMTDAIPSMRVLLATESPLLTTSPALQTRRLARHLCSKGYEVFIMAFNHQGEDFFHPEGWIMTAGGSNFGATPLNGVKGVNVIDRELNRIQPDVVYTDLPIWALTPLVQSCNQFKLPLVSYISHRGLPISRKWVELLSMIHTPVFQTKSAYTGFMDLVWKYNSKGTGVIQEERTPFLDRFAIEGESVQVIPFTPDTRFGKMKKTDIQEVKDAMGLPDWKFTFLSIGRNLNHRQYPRLLEAFRKLVYEEGGKEYGLIIHSGNPQDTDGRGFNLISLVEQMGLSRNVAFSDQSCNMMEGLSVIDVNKLYNIADAFVTASSAFSKENVLLEALACGLPVIAPNANISTKHEEIRLVPLATQVLGRDEILYGMVDEYSLKDTMLNVAETSKKHKGTKTKGDEMCESLEEALVTASTKPHPNGNNAGIQQ